MKLKTIIPLLGFLSLILISFLAKLIEFNNPFSGFHLLRQIDNLIAIESYFIEGIELKRRIIDGSSVVYEMPIYQALVAFLSSSQEEILFVARSVNLVLAIFSVVVLFKIARILFDLKTAIYSTLFFTFAPLNLSYQRGVMMDILTVFFCLTATWLLLEYFHDKKRSWVLPLFTAAGGLSVVTKALYFFPVGAIALANFINQCRFPFYPNLKNYIKKNIWLVLSFFIIVTLMLLWIEVANANNKIFSMFELVSSWNFLFSPKYYGLLLFRFILLILNPFTFLFFLVGLVLIWQRYKNKEAIALPILIPSYFVIFGQTNLPHEYYSLIMVPFCSLVAGVGAAWLEEILSNNKIILGRNLICSIFCLFSALVSVFIFLLNFIIGSPSVEQKPVQIAQEMKAVLEPRQNALIYANANNFPAIDFIKYNRSLLLLYVLNLKSEKDIKLIGRPISDREMFYALRQYGLMHFTQGDIPSFELDQFRQTPQESLRYVMFYRYYENQKSEIKNLMTGHKVFYESDDWIVYDLYIEKLKEK